MQQLSLLVRSKPLVLITILFMIGIISGLLYPMSWMAYAILVAIVQALILVVPNSGKLIPNMILIILLGSIRLMLSEDMETGDLREFQPKEGRVYEVSSIVRSISETRRGTPKFTLSPISIDGRQVRDGDLILYAKELSQIPGLKDTLTARMSLFLPGLQRNPHDFDYRSFLYGKQIYLEAFAERGGLITINHYEGLNVPALMSTFRSHIQWQFNTYCHARSSSILSALILGDRTEVDQDTREDFANTGVIHVLAVSGLHVGYVTLILIALTGFFRVSFRLQSGCVILGLGFYMVLTGGAASVTRASLMASLLVLSRLMERKSDIYNTLSASALIMLLISPRQLTNIGFQLSFCAVLSIVVIYPRLKILLNPKLDRMTPRVRTLAAPIADLFLVSLAAQLGTLPLTLFYFQKLPIISLLANLFVVPLIGLIVAIGLAFLILGWISPFFASSWGALLDGLIDILLWMVHYFGSFSWAYASTRNILLFEVLLLTFSILAMVLRPKHLGPLISIVSLLFWLNMSTWKDLLKPPRFEIVMLDVGQGDAILLHTPQGHTILVDAGLRFGGRDMGREVIEPYLRYRQWKQIDLLILTHPHNDHIGGAEYLISLGLVSRIHMPDIKYDSFGYHHLQALIDSLDIPNASVHSGHIDSLFAPLYLRTLAPRVVTDHEPTNINNSSIVIQGFYGNASFLLTGDAEQEVENYEVNYDRLLRSDILKAPHHGSRTSSSARFVKKVAPEICLISLGKNNKFRHPSRETIDLYENIDAGILRTDELGAVVLQSDGSSWSNKNWREVSP